LKLFGGGFDLPGKTTRIELLEAESVAPDFWNDAQDARQKMQEISNLRTMVDLWDDLQRRVADTLELHTLAADDPALLVELEQEAQVLAAEFTKQEFALALAFTRGRAALMRRIGRKCFCACICAGPKSATSKPLSPI
jgi:peptide chain release factor 2